jgi:hypothetical protein
MKENTLYVERFRPTELKYYVGNENVKDTIQKYLDQGDIQNFIFLWSRRLQVKLP